MANVENITLPWHISSAAALRVLLEKFKKNPVIET